MWEISSKGKKDLLRTLINAPRDCVQKMIMNQ